MYVNRDYNDLKRSPQSTAATYFTAAHPTSAPAAAAAAAAAALPRLDRSLHLLAALLHPPQHTRHEFGVHICL